VRKKEVSGTLPVADIFTGSMPASSRAFRRSSSPKRRTGPYVLLCFTTATFSSMVGAYTVSLIAFSDVAI
jgi:hypothetical protein